MVVFGQKLLYSDKSCFICTKWLYSGKWLYWGKSGCIRAKVAVYLQSGFNVANGLYSGKNGCYQAKRFYSGKSGCIQAKLVVFGQSGCIQDIVVLFGQSGCVWEKVVIFEQMWLYSGRWLKSGKSGCIFAT